MSSKQKNFPENLRNVSKLNIWPKTNMLNNDYRELLNLKVSRNLFAFICIKRLRKAPTLWKMSEYLSFISSFFCRQSWTKYLAKGKKNQLKLDKTRTLISPFDCNCHAINSVHEERLDTRFFSDPLSKYSYFFLIS